MRLLSTSEFATRLATPYTDAALATSELLLDAKPTGLIVTGAVLEAAVEWRGYRIAFLTDRKLEFFRHFRIEGKPQPESASGISAQSETTARTQALTPLPRRDSFSCITT
ncbi:MULTISPECIES: hypothetical protein [unclassified Duganella]|uniref:hypothetical protein n=1 Tax=unclassified Duganella TaxID=2636909 RepID=UPI0011C1199F|nr:MULTISPECIES: hypothetical protein [unclassified Duganella]